LIKKPVQLEERRTKVKDLQEQTKSLKRKLEIRKEFMPITKRLKLSEGKVSRFENKTRDKTRKLESKS
jgi:hypothetical protein